jgi:endoglucanase
MKISSFVVLAILFSSYRAPQSNSSWVRVNWLGYTPGSLKTAVFCSKLNETITSFELLDS